MQGLTFVALGLLGELGQINGIVVTHFGGIRSVCWIVVSRATDEERLRGGTR